MRFYDPALARWHSTDLLAEDYIFLSPYNYVANNPIRLIDPNGMNIDEYGVDKDGNVKFLKEKEGPDELYKIDSEGNKVDVDSDGELTEGTDFVTVNDETILPSLEEDGTATSISETSGNDAFNVFKFAADNSKVEWGFARHKTDDARFAVWTKGARSRCPKPDIGLGLKNVDMFIHNHPGTKPTTWHENMSMGKIQPGNGKTQVFNGSDWWDKIHGGMPYKSYVYFPRSTNVYQIKEKGIGFVTKFDSYK